MTENNQTIITRDVYGNEFTANLADLTQTIRVYAVIVRDDALLLTKQWDGYSLPGGGVELAESLEDALERELKEETGLDIKAGRIFFNADRLFQVALPVNRSRQLCFSTTSQQSRAISRTKLLPKVKKHIRQVLLNGFR